jgi:hypothetical protein
MAAIRGSVFSKGRELAACEHPAAERESIAAHYGGELRPAYYCGACGAVQVPIAANEEPWSVWKLPRLVAELVDMVNGNLVGP